MASNVVSSLKAGVKINLGCGTNKRAGYLNVDKYKECSPDLVHDLDEFPYPFANAIAKEIIMIHVLEHLTDWWAALQECARILRVGGILQIDVPDESNSGALGFRDHKHVFTVRSFHGTVGATSGTSGWGLAHEEKVPLKMTGYFRIPYPEYQWMTYWPFSYALVFCTNHMRNFIHTQRFIFEKVKSVGTGL